MVFSSLEFIFIFLTIFLLVYYIVPARAKNGILLLGSLIFYAYGTPDEPIYVLLLMISILLNCVLGQMIGEASSTRIRKKWLRWGLFYNFFWLFLFKYLDFVLENINALLQGAGLSLTIPLPGLVLPIGISFYTFQIVSYLVDVYRGQIRAEKSVINMGVYLCTFPQLIAGPIVSYSEVSSALKARKVTASDVESGLRSFVIGLGMKVLLANQLGKLWEMSMPLDMKVSRLRLPGLEL